MPSEIITVVIELMFLGVNMFLALLRTHFNSIVMLKQKVREFTAFLWGVEGRFVLSY